ncbi:putative membrane protein [uncultured Candidatus Thioglobus sp.]|nr:putative membrane protein [uncultured Candidatus Thioglobus sp.]
MYFGLIPVIAQIFKPFTTLLSLPPEATLALASGVFLNLYTAIAFAAPLGLSVYDWTILGLFLGALHSIPVESAIMKKLGIDWIKSIGFRLVMAFVVLTPLLIIPTGLLFDNLNEVASVLFQSNLTVANNFTDFIIQKTYEAILLSIEIIILVSLVIFVVIFIKGLSFLQKFEHRLSTIMALLTGTLIGITYGAGVLLKEAQYMSKKHIVSVCYFLMVAHAIIENILLFVFFGADIFLLIGIRLFFTTLVFFYHLYLLQRRFGVIRLKPL